MKSGIYKIINTLTHKEYIGSSVDVKKRWLTHQRQLAKGTHHCHHLQRAWEKYGPSTFQFEIVEHVEKTNLIIREQVYLNAAFNAGVQYNSSPEAGNALGVKHTPQSRKNMSVGHTGITLTDNHKSNISEGLKGKNENHLLRNIEQIYVPHI
jgi:group I intron endonuclease